MDEIDREMLKEPGMIIPMPDYEGGQRRHTALMLAVQLNATLGTVDVNAVLKNAARFDAFLKDGTTTAP